MLLFASALNPAMITHPFQHHFARRNWQVSGHLPIVEAQILHNRALAHVGPVYIFVGHLFFAFCMRTTIPSAIISSSHDQF